MKIVISKQFSLIDEDRKRLLRSLGWGLLAVVATFIAQYLQQYGLPDQVAFLAPLLPVVINLLNKWATEHSYAVKK